MKPAVAHPPKIALALSGGGPLGAIYEIGAMCALQESLNGIDFTRLNHYVGVSAGGFIAAALANGISPRGDRTPSAPRKYASDSKDKATTGANP